MRLIAVILSLSSVLVLCLSMASGLKAAHGQAFFMNHLYWGFGALSVVLVTLTLSLLFIFKMHGIIHDLIAKLDAKEDLKGP